VPEADFRLVSNSIVGQDLYCGEIPYESVTKTVEVECSGDIQPKLFVGSKASVVMADSSLWTIGRYSEAFVERDLLAPFDVKETPFGIVVFYELGCTLLTADGADQLWDYKHNILVDYEAKADTISLTFDDGSSKTLSTASGAVVA
jgi:hypothetical protein